MLQLSQTPVSNAPRRYSLTRVISMPVLTAKTNRLWSSDKYRPYRSDWDNFGVSWRDRSDYTSPLYSYWPTYRWTGRSNYLYESPYSIYRHSYPTYWRTYPSVWGTHPRYGWHVMDYMDPVYWHRYHDPYYDRLGWYPYRSWAKRAMDTAKAVDLYRKGMIDFDTMDQRYMTSNVWENYYNSWKLRSTYPTCGTRRYFHAC